MTDLYQVIAECAHVTVDTPHGRVKTLVLKDAVVPGDAPEIKHLLDSGMIAKVGGDAPQQKTTTPTTSSGPVITGIRSDNGPVTTVPPPPLGGPGSGRDAWAAYAATQGVTVTDDMRSRDDVVNAVKAAGKPIERVE